MYNNEKTNRVLQEFDSIPLNRSEEFGIHQNKYYRIPHFFFQSKYEANIVKLMYKNYWVDTLSSNALLVNEDFFKESVDDVRAKMNAYNIKKKANEVKNKAMNEIHQKKINDLATLSTQANANLQNELIKGIIFQKNN